MHYMLYSHTDTDQGPLAHWDKVWIVKPQRHHLSLFHEIQTGKRRRTKRSRDVLQANDSLKCFRGVGNMQHVLSPLLDNYTFNISTIWAVWNKSELQHEPSAQSFTFVCTTSSSEKSWNPVFWLSSIHPDRLLLGLSKGGRAWTG